MKAHIAKKTPLAVCLNVSEQAVCAIQAQGFQAICVHHTQLSACLADFFNGVPLPSHYNGDIPAESLLVMAECTHAEMNALLNSLKAQELLIDYKAMLTPANRKWQLPALLAELRRERAALAERRK